MKQHPILFSTPMAQAILDDRKTVTRRIIKPQPIIDEDSGYVFSGNHKQLYKNDMLHPSWKEQFAIDFCPYGQVGDVLYVREMLEQHGELGLSYVADNQGIDEGIIPDTHKAYRNYAHCNIPSIHMPKWAARIWLKITEVRVERLQDIDPNDAANEGVNSWNEDYVSEPGAVHADYENYLWRDDPSYEDYHFPSYANPIESFRSLWQKINGVQSWNANPFVWVISFEVLSTTGRPSDL